MNEQTDHRKETVKEVALETVIGSAVKLPFVRVSKGFRTPVLSPLSVI